MMSWSSRKKKEAIFVPFISSEGKLFKICVLSQCILHWIHFRNIHTFTYQKTFHTLLLLVFKIVKSLLCILNPCFGRFFGFLYSAAYFPQITPTTLRLLWTKLFGGLLEPRCFRTNWVKITKYVVWMAKC